MAIYSALLIFHLLIVLKRIPYTIVWGGRLQTDTAMYRFEAVSLLLNTVFLIVVAIKAGYLAVPVSPTVLNGMLWVMAGLFLLNTIGNLLSKNRLERLIFTPITLIVSILTLVLLLTD